MSSGRVSKPLSGEWDFEVQPVLDNRWGDFHWPPTSTLIGPEVRRFAYTETAFRPCGCPGDTVSCSFGPQFWKLGPLPAMIAADTLLQGGNRSTSASRLIALNGKTLRLAVPIGSHGDGVWRMIRGIKGIMD